VLNPLRRIPGVARVDLDGVEPRELFIDLVLDKVKEHDVDVGALVERLDGVSANVVLGELTERGLRYTVRSLGSLPTLEALGELVVDERGLRLSDIAEISYREPPIDYGRHLDGYDAIALNVYKESTANTVDVVRAVNRVLREDINADPLLAGINLFVWQDQAEQIASGINGLPSPE
jgi:HAE1 family hydrophobic/amphiphilic exporter-1